jgi:DNA-binding transcriptional LysR family regulator
MNWDDLRFFLAVARAGTIRGAAQALRVSHTTVSRRIETFEKDLGTRLFDRHRDGFVPTDEGVRMLAAAERVEDDVAALTRDAAGRDARLVGHVHITTTDEFIAAFVLEDLRPLCEAHPELTLTVDHDGRAYNLAKGEADLAIRAVPLDASPPAALVSRRLAPLTIATYGAADRVPAPRWLGSGDPRLLAVFRQSSYPDLPAWGAFTSLSVIAAAARAGLGQAILPTWIGDRDPGLARLPRPDVRHMADLYLLYHPDLRANARIDAIRTVLRRGFERRRDLFEGWSILAP